MRTPILAVIVAIAVLLAAAGVVASNAARQRDTPYPPGSPQATVSSYLHLLQDGRVDRAYALVSLDMGVTAQDFHQQYDTWGQRSHRVTLVQFDTTSRIASVTVDIATFSAGPFGASDQTRRDTFTLAREDGAWRIMGPEYLY